MGIDSSDYKTLSSTVFHQLYRETGNQGLVLRLNEKPQVQGRWLYDS